MECTAKDKMAGEGLRNRSLKEALFESLSAVLSPAQDVRAAGEEQVKALEVTEGRSDSGSVGIT
jgi:hypothetical protein